MRPRGKEYLEDKDVALTLLWQDLEPQVNRKLHTLIAEKTRLLGNRLQAERLHYPMTVQAIADEEKVDQALRTKRDEVLKQYASELLIPFDKLHTLACNSSSHIQRLLGEAKKIPAHAIPVRIFSEKEMKTINDHHGKLEPNLQKLMDAAIGDDQFNFEFIANPVFVRGDGHVYDRKELDKFLKATGGKALCPMNQDIQFTAPDITPCNTLIRAMSQLLVIIESEGKVGEISEPPRYETLEQKAERKRIPENLIPVIEKFYSQMPYKHRALFDIVCRDPVSGFIMDDPVLLPDGNVYDRTIATYLLKYKNGACHLNPDITFTEKDITPCHFVIKVLLQLKENIETAVKMRQQAAAQVPKPAAGDSKAVSDVDVRFHFNPEDVVPEYDRLKAREQVLLKTIEAATKELSEIRHQLANLPESSAPKSKMSM